MEQNLNIVKTKIINKVIITSFFLIVPLYLLTIIRIVEVQLNFNLILNTFHFVLFLFLFIFYRKLTLNTKIHLYTILFLSIGIAGFATVGTSGGFIFCIPAVLINGILLGKRTASIYAVIAIVSLTLVGVGYRLNILELQTDLNLLFSKTTSLLVIITSIIYILLIVLIATSELYNYLIKSAQGFKIAKEKAEESDQLKTAFLHNMSHEIRTPLNAISGFSGMLNKPDLSEEKRKSYVSIIQNSSNQLISIITDILTISSLETKQEELNNDKVCINNIIVDLLAIFKQQAQNQNISLYAKQQLSDKQSEIYTDKTKISQILTNLISNALKFTHEGFIEFGYNLKNKELEFYVKDSGIGIKPEFYEKIFERFRQADKSIQLNYGGTGLGLSISKGFMELLNGKIWVQSEYGKGSIFYFTIPYKPVNEINKTNSPTKQNEKYRTVIVAEDEEYNFLFIQELLIDMDLKLIHAKDGKETVEIFKTNTNIDLILMDIKMPIMTGYEAAKIIKGLKPNLPIVAQSAYALEHEIEKYSGIFDDYLAKPINEEILIEIVDKYINNK